MHARIQTLQKLPTTLRTEASLIRVTVFHQELTRRVRRDVLGGREPIASPRVADCREPIRAALRDRDSFLP